MKEQDQNLEKAIEQGNLKLTQKLLSSGAEVPQQYKHRDSSQLLVILKKPERKRSIMRVGGNNGGKLEESIAKPISNMVGEANAFDDALEVAIKEGFKKSESIDLNDGKETVETKIETTDMLKKRWKLAAVVLNHYSSDEPITIDLSSRFNSKKEQGIKKDGDPQIWEEAGKLIEKHLGYGHKQHVESSRSMNDESSSSVRFAQTEPSQRERSVMDNMEEYDYSSYGYGNYGFSEQTTAPTPQNIEFSPSGGTSVHSELTTNSSYSSLGSIDETKESSDEEKERAAKVVDELSGIFGKSSETSFASKIKKEKDSDSKSPPL